MEAESGHAGSKKFSWALEVSEQHNSQLGCLQTQGQGAIGRPSFRGRPWPGLKRNGAKLTGVRLQSLVGTTTPAP